MKKFLQLTMLSCVSFSAAACQTPSISNPCDLLVAMTPKAETSSFIVKNDRTFGQQVASHRGRYRLYNCGGKDNGN